MERKLGAEMEAAEGIGNPLLRSLPGWLCITAPKDGCTHTFLLSLARSGLRTGRPGAGENGGRGSIEGTLRAAQTLPNSLLSP